nr:molybdopterin-guanine dinucleotide biosynthesis protein MobB [Clostridium pasteurianum]
MDTLSGSKKVISIVASKSNMGKTTLIEGLIPIFKKNGYKVGVLKYDVKNLKWIEKVRIATGLQKQEQIL